MRVFVLSWSTNPDWDGHAANRLKPGPQRNHIERRSRRVPENDSDGNRCWAGDR